MPLLVLAQQAATASDDASGRLSMVITALVVLAVLIAVATVVFWRLTRPEPVEPAMRWTGPSVGESATAAAPSPAPSAAAAPTAAPSAKAPNVTAPNVTAPNVTAPDGAVTSPRPEARAEQPRTAG